MIWQEVDEGDMKTLDALLPANAGERRTLADIIFSKLESFEAGKTTTVVHEGQGGMSDFFLGVRHHGLTVRAIWTARSERRS